LIPLNALARFAPGGSMVHDRAESASEYLTRADVAELLGVSANTVARWAREGRIPCYRTLGGHRRFARAVVEDLLRQMKAKDPPPRKQT
jgi:excisionase family DNA binding protein